MNDSPVALAHAHSLSRWKTLVSQSFVPLEIPETSVGAFDGLIRSRAFDDFFVCEISSSAHTVIRTPELAAADDRPYFKLSLILSGDGQLVQDGREAVLTAGDLAVYDTDRPYTLSFDRPFRSVVLMFPHELLQLPPDSISQLTAVRMPGDQRIGGVVSPFLSQMSKNLDHLSGASGQRLSHNALDLITTMFSSELDLRSPDSSPQQRLLRRIHSYIDQNLGDPTLGPRSIADAHFISTRHLHSLFRLSDITVSSWIRARRLEHCRRALSDPVCADHTVASISTRWGFSDAAHFARAFRSAFGTSPRDFRRHHS